MVTEKTYKWNRNSLYELPMYFWGRDSSKKFFLMFTFVLIVNFMFFGFDNKTLKSAYAFGCTMSSLWHVQSSAFEHARSLAAARET